MMMVMTTSTTTMRMTTSMIKIINLCSTKCDPSSESQDQKDLKSNDDNNNNDDDNDDINKNDDVKNNFKNQLKAIKNILRALFIKFIIKDFEK